MGGHAPACRSTFCEDEHASHTPHRPASLPRDLTYQAGLAVEHEQRGLHIGHDRLDLDGEDRPRRRMESQDVDRTAFATNVEGRLDDHLPAQRPQLGCHDVDQRCVIWVQESIERLAIPAEMKIQPGRERANDAIELSERQLIATADFEAPDHGAGGLCRRSQIDLAPAATASKRANLPTEPDRVHRRSLRAVASLAMH